MKSMNLNVEGMEKATGGAGYDYTSFMAKCKYQLKWTKQQYLDWAKHNGATETELHIASMIWDSI